MYKKYICTFQTVIFSKRFFRTIFSLNKAFKNKNIRKSNWNEHNTKIVYQDSPEMYAIHSKNIAYFK